MRIHMAVVLAGAVAVLGTAALAGTPAGETSETVKEQVLENLDLGDARGATTSQEAAKSTTDVATQSEALTRLPPLKVQSEEDTRSFLGEHVRALRSRVVTLESELSRTRTGYLQKADEVKKRLQGVARTEALTRLMRELKVVEAGPVAELGLLKDDIESAKRKLEDLSPAQEQHVVVRPKVGDKEDSEEFFKKLWAVVEKPRAVKVGSGEGQEEE